MLKLIEAAKRGNLEGLKKLKDDGVNLSKKDEDGNTALLWAASYGHLDVVKWLLKESGYAKISERNNAGNTALLLAVAYGHFSLVQWFLKEGGSNPSEKNCLGNNSLFLAAKHGQLDIFDYLVRYYYLATVSNLDCFPENKAINYYLKVIEFFSKKPFNYSELRSLMDIASNELKDNELTYIHFIYFWMEISVQGKKVNGSFGENNIEFHFQRLLPFQQSELISHMFHTGYVLNDRPCNRDNSNWRGVFLNKNQIKSIDDILKKSQNDHHLISCKSEREKSVHFHDFYLYPLYRSVTHAHRIKAKIDTVLLSPYTYYLSATREHVVDDEVAKWTAYHFCQDEEFSLQQHLNIYVRISGLGRHAYYEVIQRYLDEYHPLKNLLLQSLGSLADINGERLYWTKNHPVWVGNLSQRLSNSAPLKQTTNSTPTLKLIGQNQIIPLKHEIAKSLWNSIKHEVVPSKLPGNHPVYHLKEQGVYCKLYPGLPGITDALQYLYRRLFGAADGLPWSVTGLLEIDNQTIPLILSEDVGTRVQANDVRLKNLNLYVLSKLILFSILTNPEDGKSDNYTLQKNAKGQYDIYNVDYDQGMVDGTTESDYWLFKTQKLSMKSLLFCLDAMNYSLDQKAIQELLAINVKGAVEAWLNDLIKLELEYKTLFKDCNDYVVQEKMPHHLTYLEIVAPVATVMNITHKLQQLQTILRNNLKVTPLSLLQRFEPTTAYHYQNVLKLTLSATQRFDKLIQEGQLYGWDERSKSYSTTLTSSKELFESLVPDNRANAVSPQTALNVFKQVTQKWEQLQAKQILLFKGELAQFIQLNLKDQQALIKLIRFNQLHIQPRELLLEHLAYREDFTELHLHYPQDSLLDWHLSYLLKNNRFLNKLSIKGASALTTLSSLDKVDSLTHLRLVQLSKIDVFTADLPNVSELIVKNMPEMKSLHLNAPQLKRVSIINCPNLKLLRLPQSVQLTNVSILNCDNMVIADFYSRWPGFISRWDLIPERLRQRLAHCIMEFFPITPLDMGLSQKIYSKVTEYLDQLTSICKPLIEQLKTEHDFSAAYVLAHIGYDYPEIINTLFDAIADTGIHFTLRTNRQEAAVRALCALKIKDERMIKPLSHLFNSNDMEQWRYANEIVNELQINDVRILSHLFQGLDNPDYANQAHTTLTKLNVLNKKSTRKVDIELDAEDLIQFDALRNEHIPLRLDALSSLKKLIRDDFKKFKLLLQKAEGNDCKQILEAINTLHRLQPKEGCIVDALYNALTDKDRRTRESAINISMALQVTDHRVYSALLTILEGVDNDRRLVANAIKALGNLFPNDEYVSSMLFDALKSNNINIFRAAAKSLLEGGDERATSAVLNVVEMTKDGKIRDVGIEELIFNYIFKKQNSFKNSSSLYLDLGPYLSTSMNYVRFAAKDIIALHIQDERLAQICIKVLRNNNPYYNGSSQAFVGCYNIEEMLKKQFTALLLEKNDIIPSRGPPNQLLAFPEKQEKNECQTALNKSKNNIGTTQGASLSFSFLVSKEENIRLPAMATNATPASKLIEQQWANKSLLQAVQSGDLETVKYLSKKDASALFEKNQCGSTMLSLAANRGDLPIVDYLIRHYYFDATFDEVERRALGSFSKNDVLYFYITLFNLFHKSQLNHSAIEAILAKAAKQLPQKDASFIYLIYFWIKIRHQSNTFTGSFKRVASEPGMHQLLETHRLELVSYMIQEGQVLENCSIDDNQLVIEDMVIYEKQINAIEKLLLQSRYVLCLDNGCTIEKHKIYLEMNEDGSLRYKVIGPSNDVCVGLIPRELVGSKLTAPLTLDQLTPGILIEFLSQAGHVHFIYRLRFSNVEFTTTGFQTFLPLLSQSSTSPLLPKLQVLELQGCGIEDEKINLLEPVLAQMPTLTHVNLDNNHLMLKDVSDLLEQIYTKNPRSLIKEFSFRFNLISILRTCELVDIRRIISMRSELKKINLEGNMIGEDGWFAKLKYKTLVDTLHLIFTLLTPHECPLTINTFLKASFINFYSNGNGKIIELKLNDKEKGRCIHLILDAKQYQSYYSLCLDQQGIEEFSPNKIFAYLQSGLGNSKMHLDVPLVQDEKNRKNQIKELVSYHTNTNLKGIFNIRGLFFSERVEHAQSILFPEKRLTISMGRFYLMVNNRANSLMPWDKQHALLGYEFLTGHGQRVFKIAHLSNFKGAPKVAFFKKHELDYIKFMTFLKHYDIAQFDIDSGKVKAMHKAIMEEIETGVTGDYSYIVTESSQQNKDETKRKRMNCLTWCLDKMSKHLKLEINPSLGLYITSEIVRQLMKDPSRIILPNETTDIPTMNA